MTFTHLAEPIPITEHNWPEGTIPLVTTKTITYMHEKYIRECIEGILMQKTTFPVQVLIHDDASTDATADIMREYERKYPKLIQCFYQKENTYGKPNRRDLMKDYHDAVAGKYIALCEGDDYWTDPLKLQKQVEFLEANPDYGLVHTDADFFYTVSGKRVRKVYSIFWCSHDEGNEFEELLTGGYPVVTCSALFRTEFTSHFNQGKSFLLGDTIVWLEIAHRAKIKCINESMVVHNILKESATQSKSWDKKLTFRLSCYDVIKHFIGKYGCSKECERLAHERFNRVILSNAFMAGNKAEAKRAYSRLQRLKRSSLADFIIYVGAHHVILKHPCLILAKALRRLSRKASIGKVSYVR